MRLLKMSRPRAISTCLSIRFAPRSVRDSQDLDVESYEFNERWTVSCSDERLGHAMPSLLVIKQLLAPIWSGRIVVIERQMIVTYTTGHTDLVDLEQIVSAFYALAGAIPACLGDSRAP